MVGGRTTLWFHPACDESESSVAKTKTLHPTQGGRAFVGEAVSASIGGDSETHSAAAAVLPAGAPSPPAGGLQPTAKVKQKRPTKQIAKIFRNMIRNSLKVVPTDD